MSGLQQTVSTVTMVAALILAWSGVRMILRPSDRVRGVLMVVMALVLIGNVAIWTV